jgi:predicted O-methyltransferase YrrM
MIFAADVKSAVSKNECQRLSELAKNGLALELGSHFGRSTIALASTARKVHAVDWHRGDGHAGLGNSLKEFMANLERYKVSDKVIPHVGRFEDVLPIFAPLTFDIAFLDGCHLKEMVQRDIGLVRPLLRRPGVLACHDYGHKVFGVTEVVDALCAKKGLKLELAGTVAIMKFP